MGSIDEILADYEALRPGQEAFYQDLHRHPELSHQEHDTARRVADRLQGDGLTVQTGIGGTGVVGVLANGTGPTVLPQARARSCRPPTASRSPSTGGAGTAPCRSTPSIRWCSPP